MKNLDFEKLLEEPILNVENSIENTFEKYYSTKKKPDHSFYNNVKDINMDFFGFPIQLITLITKEDDIVDSVSLLFGNIVTRKFYNSFVEKYGEPDHIFVKANMKEVISNEDSSRYKDTDLSFHQNLTKREWDLIEGTFEDKPVFIIWKKDNYYIQVSLRHEQDISNISFSSIDCSYNFYRGPARV